MSAERELLASIGDLACAEHAAWAERNKKRAALQSFYQEFTKTTGEWFDADDEIANGDEDGYAAKFEKLKAESKEAQQALTKARSATRRAIVRAAAEIGKDKP